MLQIAEHKIRYWDSIDPQTKKYRVDGISTKSNGGTRYFNRENIKKLQKLKDILYDGKKQNYTIKLAEKILSSKNLTPQKEQIITNHQDSNKDEKVEQILYKMRLLLKNINIK